MINSQSHLKRFMTKSTPNILWSIFRFVLFAGLAYVIISPIIFKLSTSFKTTTDLYDSSVLFIPKSPTLQNYIKVLKHYDYPSRFMTSVGFGVISSFLQLASCTMVAYGIARFKFRGNNLIYGMAIATLIVPPQTILLPLYFQFDSFSPITLFTLGTVRSGISLIGTPFPVLLLSLTAVGFKNGLYIFMLRQYFRNQPKELSEAAYIDGCNRFRTFIQIMLPGAFPVMASIFLFSFVWQWNDYYYSSILLTSPDQSLKIFSTVFPNVGTVIATGGGILVGNMQAQLYDSAAMIIHILPLLVLYVFTQRFFVQSIERSGMVG